MTNHSENGHALTRNQSLVLGALTHAKNPLTAYGLLDLLRDEGLKAPLQIYRALDKLVEFGMVHRIESLNSFIACNHTQCVEHDSVAFMICDTCGDVHETSDEKVMKHLSVLTKDKHFSLKKAAIELRGTCASCQKVS